MNSQEIAMRTQAAIKADEAHHWHDPTEASTFETVRPRFEDAIHRAHVRPVKSTQRGIPVIGLALVMCGAIIVAAGYALIKGS